MKKQVHRVTWEQLKSARPSPAPEFSPSTAATMALAKIAEYEICSGAVSEEDKDAALICMLSAVAAVMCSQFDEGAFKVLMRCVTKQAIIEAKNSPQVKP